MAENVTVIKQDNIANISSTGVQGPRGSIIYSNVGTPSSTLGVVGDYYIDSASKQFYGPKTQNGWGTPNFPIGGQQIYIGTTTPSNTIGYPSDIFIDSSNNTVYTKLGDSWNAGQVLVNPSNFSYIYEQQTNSTTWHINHNLHYRPNVQVTDYGQNNLECDITQIDANNIELDFNTPVSGYAYLS